MSDTLPSTPRHLKRLSLSVSSPSNSPYNSPSIPRTPGSSGSSRNQIPLKLSLSAGNNNNYNRHTSGEGSIEKGDGRIGGSTGSPLSPPTSAPANSSNSSFRTSLLNGGNTSSWNYPEESSNSPASSPTTTSTRPVRTSRRTSSISYSNSRDTTSAPSSPFLNSSTNPSNHSSTPSLSPTFTRSLLSRDTGTARGLNERYSNGNLTPPASANLGLDNLREEEEEEGMQQQVTSSSMTRDEASSQSDSRSIGASGLGNPSTITELNADLLSFIAKKERKCLDLREELKRHEEELKGLKKKWETIVAKSVAAASAPPPLPPVSSTTSSTRQQDPSSRTKMFPRNSNLPIPRSPQHALDLSLLSSTFNQLHSEPSITEDTSLSVPGVSTYGSADLESELAENVQAAKNWMGGVFGKVMEVVGGVEGNQDSLTSLDIRNGTLAEVIEEEEEEEEEDQQATPQKSTHSKQPLSPSSHRSSEASVSSLDDWQASRASTTSLASADSSSSFFGQFYSSSTSTERRSSDLTTADLTSRRESLPESIDNTPSPYQSPLPLEPNPLPASSFARPPRVRPEGSDAGHNRRRSTFDILGSAAGGGWNSLGKKWSAVTTSETFKKGSGAIAGAVDSFERKLTETLGPLEGPSPPLSQSSTPVTSPSAFNNTSLPAGVGAGVFSSWKTTSPQAVARRDREESSNKFVKKAVETDWDWTSFLDGSSSNTNTNPTTNSITPRGSLSKSTGANRKPSVMNLFDDLAAATGTNSNNSLPPPLNPTISPINSPNISLPPSNILRNSNSLTNLKAPRRSTSTPQLDVDKEVEEWGKW